jgi:[acyl-carrier-protein] S-malonyltransferase
VAAKTALVFPGQGSQAVGMGRDIYEAYPAAAAVFDTADKLLNRSLTGMMFDGPFELLTETVNTQLAVFVMNHACFTLYQAGSKPFDFVLGHSLGEFNALVAAGVFSYEEGLSLVVQRGSLMQEAAMRRIGKMLAVLGLDEAAAAKLVDKASARGFVGIANYNCPGQIVISGDAAILDSIQDELLQAGAKKVVEVPVNGAFHSPMMAAAADEFREDLNDVEFKTPIVPVCSNFTGEISTEPAVIKEALRSQMTGSVQWTKSVEAVTNAGAGRFVELGEGRILSGLIKRTAGPDVEIINGRSAYE